MTKFIACFATFVAVATLSGTIDAATAPPQIRMLNKGPTGRFVYTPELLRIEPGETVTFIATDKGHNAVSIDGMLPSGAEPIKIPFNKDATLTLTKPGIYGVKCTPHVGLGMVTLIVVGKPDDLSSAEEAAGKLPPKARARVRALLKQI